MKASGASGATPLFDPERGALFDLSRRAKFRVTGQDSLRFLNGQMTNDARKATATDAIQACFLNAKGKINAVVFVSADDASFSLDAETELREELPARLDRYIIADDVQIEDTTDQFALFHVTGEEAPEQRHGAKVLRVDRFGCSGWDIRVDSAAHAATFQELRAAYLFSDDEETERFRIERGIPRWGHELTDEIIPVEANMEATAIDYAKGCYIGQEVISRMKMSGQTSKRLSGLVSLTNKSLMPGMHLVQVENEAKQVGWITSATYSARRQNGIGLGYVKRGFNSSGTRLKAIQAVVSGERDSIDIEVRTLPFS